MFFVDKIYKSLVLLKLDIIFFIAKSDKLKKNF